MNFSRMKSIPKSFVVYKPESALRDPMQLLEIMRADVSASIRIGARLARRDLDAQFRQTVFGYLWAVLPILIFAGLWIALNRATVLRVDTGSTPYWTFVLSGMVCWQLFIDALTAPLAQLQGNRTLLARINFPRESLLVSGILQSGFTFIVRLTVLVAACLLAGVPLCASGVLAVLPLAGLMLLGTMIGVLLVPIGALYGDVGRMVTALATPLMLLSPVAYPVESAAGRLRTVVEWNPVTPLLSLTRDLALVGSSEYWNGAILVSACSGLALIAGWIGYRIALPILIEKLDA